MYAIIEHWDEEPYTAIYATDASLLRIQRYCNLFDLTLQAYGDMQVFSEPFDLSKSCIRLTVRNHVEGTRQTRYQMCEDARRRDAMAPDELEAENRRMRLAFEEHIRSLDPFHQLMARIEADLLWGELPTDIKFDGLQATMRDVT